MTGYDPAARDAFVKWFSEHRHAIALTAIVTKNTLWHMVIKAMSLATRHQMVPVATLDAAMQLIQKHQRERVKNI